MNEITSSSPENKKPSSHKMIIIVAGVVIAIVAIVLVFVLSNSGSGKLSGTYQSESGKYTIDFEKNGECTWRENSWVFEGTYEKESDEFILTIQGSGLFATTEFHAVPDDKDLIVTGGSVDGERFVKQ